MINKRCLDDKDFSLSIETSFDLNETEEKIVSFLYKEKGIGCAFFDLKETKKLFILVLNGKESPIDVVKTILLQEQPTKIIIPFDCHEDLFEAINQFGYLKNTLAVPEKEYKTQLKETTSLLKYKESSPLSFQSVQLLLSYLKKNSIELPEQTEELVIEDGAFLDTNTLYSLEVFESSKKKTDDVAIRSLFDLLNHTQTALGAQLLRRWLACPLKSVSKIKERADVVEWLIENKESEIQKELFIVKNTNKAVLALKEAPTFFNFSQITTLIICTQKINRLLPSGLYIQKKLEQKINTEELTEIVLKINKTVDMEESKKKGRCCVAIGINERLDELKKKIQTLPETLSKEAIFLSQKYFNVAELCVVYYPHLGCLISIKRTENKHVTSNPMLEYVFKTETHQFFKSEEMLVLDKELGDIHNDIVDIETEIIQELFKEVEMQQKRLLSIYSVIAEVDCLLSLSISSKDYTRPIVISEPVFRAKNSRHPLQERNDISFIPNDIEINEKTPMLFLTGANGSGKSVFMKQIGLLFILAQIGCFVPADDGCVVGIADRILTRIKTRESSIKGDSSFLTDLKQTEKILNSSTSNSLVFLDEFGKGTAIEDGIGLYCGTLFSLCKKKVRSVAISHFSEITKHNLLSSVRKNIKFVSMEIEEANGFVSYSFKIKEGVSYLSFGHVCAEKAGIKQSIIERCKKISKEEINQEDVFFHVPMDSREKKCVEIFSDLESISKKDISSIRCKVKSLL